MQEEIQIQGESKRTVVKYFTTYSGQTPTEDTVFYAISNLSGAPLKLTESELETKYFLDSQNINIEINQVSSQYLVYSGTVVESEVNTSYTQDQKNEISDFYVQSILNRARRTYPANNSLSDIYSAVFFEEYPFNDYFLNVKINRSMNTLDTLNIYNVTEGLLPKYNNNTGVLFGKLEALQVLSDENGEKIRIPLKNVVVGIFNPSEKFPSISSLDEEGNRIRLNIFETIPTVNNPYNLKGYSSFQSYLTDIGYSKNDGGLEEIPDEYKYVTITDENGNFVLHNVPVGQQTLMVEVDLLKFGLEPEEVALNFFPYPTEEDPNVSNVPHLFFGQYPINIVPSWGEFQTGYTEMKLSIALDLRKWVTYYTFPVSSEVGKGSKQPRALEELYAAGIFNPLKVFFRDMTKPFVENNPPKVEVVKIIDIYDKNIDLYNAWNNEFKVKNNKVEFDTSNFNAFKLPANLYDPNGINTKGEKGVWLAAYQIKIAYPDASISYQVTGWDSQWLPDEEIKVNHYDLTNYLGWWDHYQQTNELNVGIGIWPYEKPWSLTYPEPYKITKKPSVTNPYKQWDSNGDPITSISGYTINPYKEPKHLDGDLVGGDDSWNTNANGYGLQNYEPLFWGNQFAREVTKNEIWCYEDPTFWGFEYSNGYSVTFDSSYNDPKYSSLPGIPIGGRPRIFGERFQRIEAGYGYWLKPRGWPRIDSRFNWGDTLLYYDHSVNATDRNTVNVFPGYFSYFNGTYKYIDEVTLRMGPKAPWWSQKGYLVMYRVEKPYYTLPKKPPFVETFVNLDFGVLIGDGTSPGGGSNRDNSLCNFEIGTQQGDQFFYALLIDLRIDNLGSIPVTIISPADGPHTLDTLAGEYTYHFRGGILYGNFSVLTLPGNAAYNPNTNTYERADYRIWRLPIVSGQDYQPNAPYGGTSGEGCYADTTEYSPFELFYDYDGKRGLPAYPEGNPKSKYYLTTLNTTPVDIYNKKFKNGATATGWGFVRANGIMYMARHGNWGTMPTLPKFTNTKPSVFLPYKVGQLNYVVLKLDWGAEANDFNFSNIP